MQHNQEIIGIDLMAKGKSHCLYHLGFNKYFNPSQIFLHDTSYFKEASLAYKKSNANNVHYSSFGKLLYKLVKVLFQNKDVHLLGINLKLLIFLLPFMMFKNSRLTIHLHGQIYALKNNKSLKYLAWRFIAIFCELVVSNPAYSGPDFVKKIRNINHILDNIRGLERRNFRMKCGSIHKTEILNLPEDLKGILQNSEDSSYSEYCSTLLACSHVLINFDDDYYCYSPSGRLSDALNFSQTVVINANNMNYKAAEKICDDYGVAYVHLSELSEFA